MFINFCFTFLTIVLIGNTAAWTDYLNFDSCSTYQIYEVNEDKSFNIDWNGYQIDTYSCKIGFHGWDSDHVLNKYKVCVQATYWDLKNSRVEMKYYTGISDFLQRTYSEYSGYNPTVEWCSEPGEYVDIELDTASTSDYQGRISLEVRGVMTYDYYGVMGWAIGGTIGGVVLLLVFITIMIIACRKRRVPGDGMIYGTANNSNTNTIITQSGSQQMGGGLVNPGYAISPAPPSYFDVTKNAYIQVPVQNYQPPPSYQQYSEPGNTQQTTGNTQQTVSSTEQTTQNESTQST